MWEFLSPSYRNAFHKKIRVDLNSPDVKVIECAPLGDILKEHGPRGSMAWAALDVLQYIDSDAIGFGIMVVEAQNDNDKRNPAERSLLESKGYMFLYKYKNRMLQNGGKESNDISLRDK